MSAFVGITILLLGWGMLRLGKIMLTQGQPPFLWSKARIHIEWEKAELVRRMSDKLGVPAIVLGNSVRAIGLYGPGTRTRPWNEEELERLITVGQRVQTALAEGGDPQVLIAEATRWSEQHGW